VNWKLSLANSSGYCGCDKTSTNVTSLIKPASR
jgi:hypothetical protein